jgi:hypothetical protein
MNTDNARKKAHASSVGAILVVIGFLLSGCTMSSGIPGVPDVKFDVPDTSAQSACKQFARAFVDGTTRESITAGLQRAQGQAAAGGDLESSNIAQAIDDVLANTVVGTQDSLYAAVDVVIAACSSAGINIEVE